MSVRYYCDLCGEELVSGRNAVSSRVRRSLEGQGGRVFVEIIAGTGSTSNRGHLHAECVMKVVADGQDL